ncbi:uncharacterized protein [Odocoileus virginianus]|uniref:Uncharacterized protein isoform X6 n=1 Tax=Odocoileus virginianus TaxID=9874 RepID=A0ABM4HEH7_ODOVR
MGQPVPSPGQCGLLTLKVGLWKEPVNDSQRDDMPTLPCQQAQSHVFVQSAGCTDTQPPHGCPPGTGPTPAWPPAPFRSAGFFSFRPGTCECEVFAVHVSSYWCGLAGGGRLSPAEKETLPNCVGLCFQQRCGDPPPWLFGRDYAFHIECRRSLLCLNSQRFSPVFVWF